MIGIKVIKKDANNIRLKLLNNKQISMLHKVMSDEKYVYIPLISNYDNNLITKLNDKYDIEFVDYDFTAVKYRPKNFMEYLDTDKIPKNKVDEIRKSFDIIGDIVILEIPEELENEKYIIADAVLKFTRRKSVYYKKSKVHGVRRVRDLEFLAGVDNLETTHKEFGLKFRLNPSTVYFSPRLATERSRIVNQVKDDEIIIDFFAGVGSFPINIASKKDVTIYNVDINPEAIKYANENIKINQLIGKIIPLCGDIRDVIIDIPMADRIIMNLPGTSRDFLPEAINHLNVGGILNYYEFATDENIVIEHIKEIAGNRKIKVLNSRKVRSQSPGVWHIGVDVQIE